jgi:hypothetical protein
MWTTLQKSKQIIEIERLQVKTNPVPRQDNMSFLVSRMWTTLGKSIQIIEFEKHSKNILKHDQFRSAASPSEFRSLLRLDDLVQTEAKS